MNLEENLGTYVAPEELGRALAEFGGVPEQLSANAAMPGGRFPAHGQKSATDLSITGAAARVHDVTTARSG